MAVDNTHTKYLKGSDKKAWNNYKEAIEAQNKLEGFLGEMNLPDLGDGEEFEIPINKGAKQGSKE